MNRLFLSASVLMALAACTTDGSSPTTTRSGAEQAIANSDPTESVAYQTPETEAQFAAFVPAPSLSRTRVTLDYGAWNDILDAMVIYTGPSTRTRALRPSPGTGTRIVTGHDSPFRLEGNKIFFSGFDEDIKPALTAYREDLERIANEADITTLNRNEQLAFWLNFYNVITIEQIALKYPVQRPAQMRIGDNNELFDDAKIITIKGVPLSLKDIRTKIVYPNWQDSRIVYGFFRGDIGGPTIQGSPFTRTNVSSQLDRNAREFVNSLRGVYRTGNTMKVSQIYEEARPFYFQNWPQDLKNHLLRFMNSEVVEEFTFEENVEFQRYETRVADLAGGELRTQKSLVLRSDIPAVDGMRLPESTVRMLQELDDKVDLLKSRGLYRRGRVIILDDNIYDNEPEEESDIE